MEVKEWRPQIYAASSRDLAEEVVPNEGGDI